MVYGCVLLITFTITINVVNIKMPVELEFDYEETTSEMDFFYESDINELRHWIQKLDKTKCVPKDLSDKQLVLFYNACYGSVVETKECLVKYYSYRRNAPEFFNQRSFNTEELKLAAEVLELFILPGKSCEDYEIVYHRFHDTDPANFNGESFCKLLFMTVDLSLTLRGPQSGYIFLFDAQGIKFGHLTRINLITLRKLFQYFQEALPVRMQAIHVLNASPVLDKLIILIKPFMDKKFFEMIKFHNKNEDLAKLYEIIPKSSLPPDYGGTLPDTQTMHKECIKQLYFMEPYFRAEEEQRIAASPDKFGENILEGTFSLLNID